jgi:hypothetical protein
VSSRVKRTVRQAVSVDQQQFRRHSIPSSIRKQCAFLAFIFRIVLDPIIGRKQGLSAVPMGVAH